MNEQEEEKDEEEEEEDDDDENKSEDDENETSEREENEDHDEKDKQKTGTVEEKPEEPPMSRVTSFNICCFTECSLLSFHMFYIVRFSYFYLSFGYLECTVDSDVVLETKVLVSRRLQYKE